MLLKYTVGNFKSIGKPVDFTMLPSEGSSDGRFLKTLATASGERRVLRRSGFFGPNASGKSSFIESLAFAKRFVVEGGRSGKGTGVSPFRGGPPGEGSLFTFVFYRGGDVYEYGFEIDRKRVREEWLMRLAAGGFEPLFSRMTDGAGRTDIEIAPAFAREGTDDRRLAEVLKGAMREEQRNQLFLTKLRENGVQKARPSVAWFQSLRPVCPAAAPRFFPLAFRGGLGELEAYIGEQLSALDTGVVSVRAAGGRIPFREYAERHPLPGDLAADIENAKNGIAVLDGKFFLFAERGDETVLTRLQFTHRLNGRAVPFDVEDESDGTKRLLWLLPMLFSIGKSPCIYIVDEIDRSLHTKLSRYVLSKFGACGEECLNQILFTAHDVNLINLEDWRQDEVWFVDKGRTGETSLKPLSDFDLKEGQDVFRAYLAGRFGGVPVLRGGAACFR